MGIDLEVLNSFDLIITTSMMQSVDESESVSVRVTVRNRETVRDSEKQWYSGPVTQRRNSDTAVGQ